MRVRYGGYGGFSLTPIWVLMSVNFLFFLASWIDSMRSSIPTYQSRIIDLFGLHPFSPEWPQDPAFLDRPWAIVTNLFVHADLWHILANMLMLYFFGSYLLGLLGEKRFLLVYFAGGLLGNVLLLALAPLVPFSVAVGASGALYAVMGALAVMRPRLKVLIWFLVPVDLWIIVAVGAVIIGTQMTSSSIYYTIAWQAHLGGLLLGLATGFYFRKQERGRFWG